MKQIIWSIIAGFSLLILSGCSLFRPSPPLTPRPAVPVLQGPIVEMVSTGENVATKTDETAIPAVPEKTPTPVTPAPKTNTYVPQTKTFTITAKDFSFSPTSIRVKQGDTVKVVFVNTAWIHTLRFDAFDVQTKTLNPWETTQLSFVASKKWSFVYYCTIHGQAMKGTLIVE